MNKKFSTLMALALLAGSLPVAAQYCPQDGEVPYRTRMVKSAKLDRYFKDVYEINENYWYQLQVDPATLAKKDGTSLGKGEYVLTVERDYSTGKLYLTARPSTDAVLTHSLWQIKSSGRDIDGKTVTFVNKETGFELTYDHYNALTRKGGDGFQNLDEYTSLQWYKDNNYNTRDYGWDFEKDGLQDGCNFGWELYTNKSSKEPFDFAPVYSYFHAGDSVMYLRSLPKEYADEVYSVSSMKHRNISAAIGVNGTDKFAIIAAKESEREAMDYIKDFTSTEALRIKPVVAGAKVLNAAEINTMIDADGSYLSFPRWIQNYEDWTDAKENDKVGKNTKFTVCKPGTEEPLTLASNPFEHTFKAVQAAEKAGLARDYVVTPGGAAGTYDGYDVLFETKDPIRTVGNDKEYGYLYVSEYAYEGQAFQGIYNGLEVKVAPYSWLEKIGMSKTGSLVSNPKHVELKYDPDAQYAATTDYSKFDALQARYHWKVTYYATNDSVVFEPLNASRMSQTDATLGKKFEETALASTTHPGNFLNTVNRGVPYGSTPDAAKNEANNTMFEKAEGVPVALYAMNFGSPAGDIASYLTVGYASAKIDKDHAVEASDVHYKASPKQGLEFGNPAYVTNNSGYEYQSEMEMTLRFDNDYTWLKRASVETGLYYINLQSKKVGNNPQHTENREFGAYIVEDFKGHVVYDAAQKEQDFSHMPATQWVVEQQKCLEKASDINYNKWPTVSIHNREFANEVFKGQLYQDREDANKLFTINHRDYAWFNSTTTVDNHAHSNLNCADTIAFEKVALQCQRRYLA